MLARHAISDADWEPIKDLLPRAARRPGPDKRLLKMRFRMVFSVGGAAGSERVDSGSNGEGEANATNRGVPRPARRYLLSHRL